MKASGHRLVLALELGLGLTGVLGATAAVAAAAASVHRDSRSLHTVLILGARFTYPAVNVAAVVLLLLAAVGVVVLVNVLRALWRQTRGYRLFERELRIVGPLPAHPEVTVITGEAPEAFCAGYLRPRVYISEGAVDLLAADELAAVLMHEQQHRRARDPLRFACARVLSQALFFMPALRPLAERYAELAEARADTAAVIAARGDKAALASALLTFDATAPTGSAGISAARVDSLLGLDVRTRLPRALIAISFAALTLLVVLVWRASAVASADATFNLPVLSSQPCMLVLALIPVAIGAAGMAARRAARPAASRTLT